MNNRRIFLTQGALAACAFTFLKPFTVNAAFFSNANLDKVSKENKLTILHGNNLYDTFCQTKKINGHVIKLAVNNTDNSSSYNNKAFLNIVPFPIQIEKRGNINIGFIHLNNIPFNTKNTQQISDLNKTALFLKEKHACHFIICNFYNELNKASNNFSEEKLLAKMSSHIDLITCKKARKLNYHTIVVDNKNRHEVIINATFDDDISTVAMLEINFDNQLKKTNVFTPINVEKYLNKKQR